jgi:NitT/TauT family transport system permease protein
MSEQNKTRITVAQADYSRKFVKNIFLQRVIFFGLIIFIWQTIVFFEIYPQYLLPSPLKVLHTLLFGFFEASYTQAICESLRRVIFGYVLASSVGVFCGLLIARYRFFDNTIGASLTALQSIPSVAWVPLALLWFGISEAAVLFIVVLEAFIPSALGTRTGVHTIPKEIIRAAQALGACSLDLYIRVIFPSIIPNLISSLRLSWAFAWRALIAGELFVSGFGIGQQLELARSLGDMAQVISMIVIIAIFGYITDELVFRNLEKRVQRVWGFN